jgi:N-methylhydantoinase A
VSSAKLASDGIELLIHEFHAEHERTYGHRAASDPVEIVNLRLVARVESPEWLVGPAVGERDGGTRPAPRERDAYFGPETGFIRVSVIARSELSGTWRRGPLIIEEYDATTVIPPDARVSLDPLGNIVVDIRMENG